MFCPQCLGSGMIERDVREVTVDCETFILQEWGYEKVIKQETVELGGIDACPSCTRMAEIEWTLST